MRLHMQQCGAVAVIRPDGPIVSSAAETLREELREAVRQNLGRVVLDASTIPFVDSQGLECLVEITCELAQSGKPLKICAADPTFKEVLELTGVSCEFEQFEDVTSAVRSFM